MLDRSTGGGDGGVAADWLLLQFLYSGHLCSTPNCVAEVDALNMSAIAALVGAGCVVLSASEIRVRPIPLLAGAVGAFAFAAWASFRAELSIMPLIDAVLMVVPIVLFLYLEPTRRATDRHTARMESYAHRLYWLAMALLLLAWFAIVFAVLTAATFGR